jgi:hypothetical protein
MSRFQIERSGNGGFRFAVIGGSGESLLRGRSYGARAAAVRAIDAIRRIAADRARYRLRRDRNGRYVLILSARNGRVLGTSGALPSRTAADAVLRRLMRLGLPLAARRASASDDEE